MDVIQNGRGGGKTYTTMTLIQEFIVSGSGGPSEVCVVVPDHSQIYFWTREWQRRFPAIAVPQVMSIRSGDRVRGKRFKFLVIENVETFEDGIYDERLFSFLHALTDGNVLVTSGWILTNWKNYTTITTMDNKMRDKLRRIRQLRRLREDYDIAAILARMIVDTDDKDLIDAVLSGAVSPAQAVELAYDADGKPRGKNH